MITFLDTETRAGLDLKKVGAHRYVQCPDFKVLMLQYAVDDGPVHVLTDEREIIQTADVLIASSDSIVAHNAAFDRLVLSALLGSSLPPEQWRDTRVIAAEHGYPGKLEDLALALGVTPKDGAGTRLINLFSKPKRDGGFTAPDDRPEEWELFKAYGENDVVTLREVWGKLPEQTADERLVEIVDQRVNDNGIAIDIGLATAAVEAGQSLERRAREEIIALTGVDNPGSVQQLRAWFAETGELMEDLTAGRVRERLLTETGDRKRVLELRQQISLASHKKFIAALDRTCADGRARGSFFYGGAHTLRWAGRGIQLQNLPRASLGDKEDEVIARLLSTGEADSEELKALVRAMLLGPFTVADYSAIEARVIAWLAGEEWAMQAFRDGRDIYVETAARMGEGMTRQDGKTATLGLGYGGGIQALKNVGAVGDDEHLQSLVVKWRQTNQRIVKFWDDLNKAYLYGGKAGRIEIKAVGSNRFLTLPSGRTMSYRGVKLVDGKYGREALWDSNRGPKKMWGGLIAENCLAGDSEVLTPNGWKRLDSLRGREQVWDGLAWVEYDRLLFKGIQQTVAVDGVRMTADHQVLTDEGWTDASLSHGLDRYPVSLPDSAQVQGEHGRGPREGTDGLGSEMCLWEGVRRAARDHHAWPSEVVRVCQEEPHPRHVEASGLCGVSVDGGPLPTTFAPGVEELRGERNSRRSTLVDVRGVLERHGAVVRERLGPRQDRQRWAVQPGELSLDDAQSQQQEQAQRADHRHAMGRDVTGGSKRAFRNRRKYAPGQVEHRGDGRLSVSEGRPEEPVYDLLNCGPRNRFVVRAPGGGQPFIVHNCTQATARDLLAAALVRVDAAGHKVVGHVHDEIIVEGKCYELRGLMCVVPEWGEGLALTAEQEFITRYRK